MANFKICILRRGRHGISPVYIRVTHNRKVGYIKTGKMVADSGLTKSGEVKDPFIVQTLSAVIVKYIESLNLRDIRHWSVDDIIKYLAEMDADVCFSDYCRRHIDKLINNGQPRSARNYQMAINSLELYAGTTKLMFSALTSQLINLWINSLSKTARAKEMYPICLRQVYKAAVLEYNDYDNNIIRIRTNPWIRVKIPHADTPQKRAITAEACREFFDAPLPASKMVKPTPELGRDVAMLVLCLAGINTVDLYHLKKEDCQGGIIRYRRAKTSKFREDGAYMEMKIPEILKPIVAKYATPDDDPYFFDFHSRYASSDSFSSNANSGIKDVCVLSLGMDRKEAYCVYTFRHTFATIAQNDCGASINDVAFALNHSRGTNVTRKYIKVSFVPAWELNQKVVDFIFGSDCESNTDVENDGDVFFRMSFKHMIKAIATYRGRIVAQICDIGYNNIKQVITALVAKLPNDIPAKGIIVYRIENLDKQQVITLERAKGARL